MSQLDTRIPLGVQPQQSSGTGGVLRTLGQLTQLQEARGLNRQRDLANEAKRRDLEDDDALTETLQNNGGNLDDAVDEMYRQGRTGVAGALSKQMLAARTQAGEALKATNLANDRRIGVIASALQGVKDQQSLETVRGLVKKLEPDYAQYVPAEYGDGSEVSHLVDVGTSRQEYLKAQNDAVTHALEASRISLDAHKDYEAQQRAKDAAVVPWTRAMGTQLSLTKSQDEWDRAQQLAVGEMGMPAAVAAQFGSVWSPEAVERAKAMAMTPAERDTSSNAAANTKLREREVKLRENEAANGTPATSRPVTATQKSQVDRTKDRRYDQFEKDIRENGVFSDATADPSAVTDPSEREKVEGSRQAAVRQMGTKKLQIENDARGQRGEPSLEAAERQYAEAGADDKLRQIRSIYRNLTGDDTPMEKVDKLFAALRTEKDPVKIASLRQQLVAARQAADAAAGR